MGRSNGTAVPLHVQMFTHPKTLAAAAVLVAEGLAARGEAPLAAVAAVARLSGWAIADGDTGRVGHLTDARLAMEAWPEAVEDGRATPAAIGAALRRALRVVPEGFDEGYLEGQQGAEERIHDFEDHWANVLENRRIARTRKRSGPAPKEEAPEPPQPPKSAPDAAPATEYGRGYDRTHDRTHGRTNDREYPASAPDPATASESAAPHTPRGGGAAAAGKPLASEVRTCLRWRGTLRPVHQALDDLHAAGVPEDAVRRSLAEPGAVGLRPFDWRDRLLSARRGAPGQAPIPPGAAPCTRCTGTGRVDAPNSPTGSMRCPRCEGGRVEKPKDPPAERGFTRTERAVGISAPRAPGGVRCAPQGEGRFGPCS